MVVWLIILATIILFIVFCSGYVYAEANAADEEVPFFKKWNEYVKDSQAGKVGPILMKILYLIPTTVAFVSWCRFKLQPALEKGLD